MYKDIISYEIAENTSEQHLLTIAKQIVETWMEKQAGFVKWEINYNKNGGYTDIVYWESENHAKNAEKEMVNIPNAQECLTRKQKSTSNFSTTPEII